MNYLEKLASRRRFGMKPGLDSILSVCGRLSSPQEKVRAVHVAGTNGKGAVAAMLDACLGGGRYTSPHLVRLNERFFHRGAPVDDAVLAELALRVENAAEDDLTFFEALTAVAFLLYSRFPGEYTVLETGLGGRLDATNICRSELAVITRVGLDHCDWLGGTLAEIAVEKAGIIKRGVPVVAGCNDEVVLDVLRRRAKELDAPFHYAPDMVDESELPKRLPLEGTFNRENAVTALAALKVLGASADNIGKTVWPGRFQRVGRFIIDGAHNPPAARALVRSLEGRKVDLIAGFCGDKDVETVLEILKPSVRRAYAVPTVNPRSLSSQELVGRMRSQGIEADGYSSLRRALDAVGAGAYGDGEVLICGSLFLAGEALVELDAYPWGPVRFDGSESLLAAHK
jgi:dihydrofolate synthase/folylpolyglutamate synthase